MGIPYQRPDDDHSVLGVSSGVAAAMDLKTAILKVSAWFQFHLHTVYTSVTLLTSNFGLTVLDAEGKSSSEKNDYDQAVLSQSGEHDTGHINGVNGHISLTSLNLWDINTNIFTGKTVLKYWKGKAEPEATQILLYSELEIKNSCGIKAMV